MGTTVKTSAFLPEYHSDIALDENTTNGERFSYHDDHIVKPGHNPDSSMSRVYNYAQLGHDREKVRQTILTHESIFRNQLQELHRIYKRQGDLMNEVKRREIISSPDILKSKLYFNQVGVNKTNQTDVIPNSRLTLDRGNANSQLVLQDLFRNSIDGMNGAISLSNFGLKNETSGNQNLFNGHADKRSIGEQFAVKDFCSAESPTNFQSVIAEPRNEFLNSPLNMCKTLSRKKRKLFGFEISEGEDDSCDTASITSSTILQNDLINFEAFSKKESNSRPQVENPNGGLPWFLKNPKDNDKSSKGTKSSYIMNLDILQENSQIFFKKCEIIIGPSQNFDQKNEISLPMPAQIGNDMSADKILVDVDCVREVKNYEISSRNVIDLNLPLDEEDASPAPFLSIPVMKIVTTEIYIENPPVIESELNSFLKEKLDFSEECDKNAADVLICISSAGEKNLLDGAREPLEAESSNCLEWFAEIISSQCGDTTTFHVDPKLNPSPFDVRTQHLQLDLNGTHDEEDSIPDGIDYFEFMTLNLKDVKEDHKFHNPVILSNPSDNEVGPGATFSKSSRRGYSRRGRYRKNFQKDILPGLVTLSRHEVNEDFHAFDEICKAEGSNSRLLQRKGRGKKRLGGLTTSVSVKPRCSTRIEMPITLETELEERSLMGWGKRTRRLPRQKCPNSYISFSVKC